MRRAYFYGGEFMARRDDVEGIGKGEFLDEHGRERRGPEDRERTRQSVTPWRCWRQLFQEKRSEPRALEPEPVVAESGRLGWRVRLPGGRPLATPAVAGGRVFLGGGFGSHEFYAFSAGDGRVLWKVATSDDGPRPRP